MSRRSLHRRTGRRLRSFRTQPKQQHRLWPTRAWRRTCARSSTTLRYNLGKRATRTCCTEVTQRRVIHQRPARRAGRVGILRRAGLLSLRLATLPEAPSTSMCTIQLEPSRFPRELPSSSQPEEALLQRYREIVPSRSDDVEYVEPTACPPNRRPSPAGTE